MTKMRETIVTIFNAMEDDGSGTVSWEEFARNAHVPEFTDYLKEIDVCASDVNELLDLFDFDRSGYITKEEMADGCVRLLGGAMAIDLAVLAQNVRMNAQEHPKLLKRILCGVSEVSQMTGGATFAYASL